MVAVEVDGGSGGGWWHKEKPARVFGAQAPRKPDASLSTSLLQGVE
jgi:hypothetical protein